MNNLLFCFGIGYVGEHLVKSAQQLGWRVGGTTRSFQKAQELRRQGIDAVIFDGHHVTSELIEHLQQATHIFSTIAPLPNGQDPVYPILHRYRLSANLAWLGYLSSVSVYGDAEGRIVTEDTPLQPLSSHGKSHAFIEADWRSLYTHLNYPVHIFRMSGVYGPKRNLLEWVQAFSIPVLAKDGLFCCRVHVEDMTRAVMASMKNPRPCSTYNVSDDEPCPPDQVTAYAYQLLGLTAPATTDYQSGMLLPEEAIHYEENRRVSAEHIKSDLNLEWHYPSYREGLEQLLRDHVGGDPTALPKRIAS